MGKVVKLNDNVWLTKSNIIRIKMYGSLNPNGKCYVNVAFKNGETMDAELQSHFLQWMKERKLKDTIKLEKREREEFDDV